MVRARRRHSMKSRWASASGCSVSDADPHRTFLHASLGTLEKGQVDSWDSQREFDPAVTLCLGHISPLLGWPPPPPPWLSLCLFLSPSLSPSHLLSSELREQEGMKSGIVLCWLQSCVCVTMFQWLSFSALALCNYADIAALTCHGGQRSREHV